VFLLIPVSMFFCEGHILGRLKIHDHFTALKFAGLAKIVSAIVLLNSTVS
jgi:hypothetical protein